MPQGRFPIWYLKLYTSKLKVKESSKKKLGDDCQSKLENVFVKHYAPNHIPDPKGEWSLKEKFYTLITKYVQKFISSSTPWSLTICQL